MNLPQRTQPTHAGLSALRFERSEAALADLNRTFAQYRVLSASPRSQILRPSRLVASRSGAESIEARRVRVEDALSRLVSIAEEFSVALLVELTEARLPTDARVATLWERYVERETDTWEQRFGSWASLHQIVFTSFPKYSPLRGFIEARNAIMHGLGTLTRKQLKNPQKAIGRLNAARVGVVSNRLILTQDHVTECAGVMRELIRWLDHEASSALGSP